MRCTLTIYYLLNRTQSTTLYLKFCILPYSIYSTELVVYYSSHHSTVPLPYLEPIDIMKLAIFSTLLSAATAFLSSPIQIPSTSTTFLRQAEETASPETTSAFQGSQAISSLTSGLKTIFSSEDISKILPHRYPFLLVDKVVEYEAGKRAVGIKSVTLIEPHFTGHFPDRPIMPGVLQVEALAQLAGIVCLQMEGAEPGAVFFFAGVDGVKWKKPVVPGDTLVMEVEIKMWRAKMGIAKATGKAYVDGELAVEVQGMTFALAR